MSRIFLLALSFATLLSAACSQAQNDNANGSNDLPKTEKKKGKKKGKKDGSALAASLQPVGELQGGVPESSGLAHGGRPGTFYTNGDAGNSPILYLINEQGELLGQRELPVPNVDWESLADDGQGTLFVTDAGNNDNSRRDLAIYRVNPSQPDQVGKISFRYPDQSAFPPPKDERNFDCEASLWHAGKVYLFTKDRAQQSTSKVYSVPDQPGSYTAELITKLRVSGEVTDADLSPDGRQLALLGREELYIFEGRDLAGALQATPKTVSLKGAGQTEGILFLDNGTLLISTEQGALYRYKL
jgi:outer membrane protein assembly factor BamB